MPIYYPQAAMTLRITWENFGSAQDFDLNKVHVLRITPKRVNVKINDYTKADTFSCEIDYKNFPFDPRTIRALGVTVHIQNMKGIRDKYGNIKRIEPQDNLIDTEDNDIVFQGFADEDSISLDDSNRMVSFEGRDFSLSTSIDAKYLPDATCDIVTVLIFPIKFR